MEPVSVKMESESRTEVPWHSVYPAPRNSSPKAINRDDLRQWLDEESLPGKDFVLVDLRRADHEAGYHIQVNEARSLTSKIQGGPFRALSICQHRACTQSIPTLYTLFAAAGVEKVIFYCGVYNTSAIKPAQTQQRPWLTQQWFKGLPAVEELALPAGPTTIFVIRAMSI